MPDRTQNTLDELADLFLTGTSGSAPAHGKDRPQRSGRDGRDGRDGDREMLDGPEPMRLPPKPAAEALRPQRPATARGAPRLRLRRSEETARAQSGAVALEDDPAPERRSAPLHVEAVALGNLPGFGAPWLVQYAHFLALEHGPVGLIHLDEQALDLELIGSPNHPMPDTTALTRTKPQLDVLLATLAGDAEQPGVSRWLVHLAVPGSQLAAHAAAHFARWTIVSGADDAAVNSAAKMLGALAGETDLSRRQLGLMVMGSDAGAAQHAAQRLGEALQACDAGAIELVGCQRQMVPIDRRDLGSFTDVERQWPQVLAFFAAHAAEPAAAVTGARAASPAPAHARDTGRATRISDAEAQALLDSAESMTPTAAEDVPRMSPSASPPPHPTAAPTQADAAAFDTSQARAKAAAQSPPPQAQSPRPSAAPQAVAEPDLAQLVAPNIPGGIALQARCPRQPQTQILLDQTGRLHLLRRHVSGSDAAAPHSLRSAIVDLVEARDWVHEHLELLQLTQRQCRFDADQAPALHLFTDDAKTAAGLVARLGSVVHLHLLHHVKVGADATWLCTDLN